MARYYLNREVFFKSKDTFSCIYHRGTGWYYPCKPDFWKTLQTYKGGKEIESQKMTPALAELVRNKFLIKKKTSTSKDYIDYYPLRVPGTVHYQKDLTVDVAVERKGAHGEIDFDIITLDGTAVQLWILSDGSKTLGEILSDLSVPSAEMFDILRDWTSLENQMVRLLSLPKSEIQKAPPQLIYKAPFLTQKTLPKPHADDVHKYHLKTIKDGAEQFDRIESTVSHLYRAAHPILDWKTYGQKLYASIKGEKEIESGITILEIGGGAGNVSADILGEMKKEGNDADYIIYDLSPALIKSQRVLHKKRGVNAKHINGNGEILALKDASIDLALSNEVIADFHTPEVATKDVQDYLFDHEIPMTNEFFNSYKGGPDSVRVNLGAFQLMKELYRVLKPGGLAVVTEFGYQDRLPFRASHLDHAEYSIQFNQMISVAAALGFNLYLTDAFDFLGFRSDVKLITAFSYQAAYRIMENHSINLPNMTYTEELLKKELGEKVEHFSGLQFVGVNKDPFKVVKVLVCQKPEEQPEQGSSPSTQAIPQDQA
jgi:ubiquinone/menaquinone biosynthesis C-methylase UbiE